MKGEIIIFVQNQALTGHVSLWIPGVPGKSSAEKWGAFCQARCGSHRVGRGDRRDESICSYIGYVYSIIGGGAGAGRLHALAYAGRTSSAGNRRPRYGRIKGSLTSARLSRRPPNRLRRGRGSQHIVATGFSVMPKYRCACRKMRKSWFFVLQGGVKRGIIVLFNGVKWGGYITLIGAWFSRIEFDRSVGSIILAL